MECGTTDGVLNREGHEGSNVQFTMACFLVERSQESAKNLEENGWNSYQVVYPPENGCNASSLASSIIVLNMFSLGVQTSGKEQI